MLELAFEPDRAAGEPVYRQLERHLQELVRARRLSPGDRLPPSRALASSLGVSRNTVNQAYQALVDRGLLRAHVGQGTYVSGPSDAELESFGPAQPTRALAWEGLLARRARAAVPPRGLLSLPIPHRVEFDLRPGRVATASFPVAAWKRASNRALARFAALGDDVDPRGHAPLREAIARSLLARGIACEADEVAITHGAQQALDLVARALVDPGDAVALEQPGYFGAELALRACEAHLVGVGVDSEGLRTDELARLLRTRRIKLLYTTPAVQSPTGVALSLARRRTLLALADEYQLPIVEDDYDSELRYETPVSPALKTLDVAGQVIYVGTFSKALFQGLRVGYLVAPRPLLLRIALLRLACELNPSSLLQATLAELLESGAFERHLRRVRRLYAERRSAFVAALLARMPEGVRFTPPVGGLSIWLALPPDADLARVHAGAAERGIALASGAPFAFEGSETAALADRHLLLSFANLPAEQADTVAVRLADAVQRALPTRRGRMQ